MLVFLEAIWRGVGAKLKTAIPGMRNRQAGNSKSTPSTTHYRENVLGEWVLAAVFCRVKLASERLGQILVDGTNMSD